MTTWRGVLGSVLVAGIAVTLTQVSFAQRQTREQQVDVAVVDDDGAPVRDLTADDFVVRENDVAREVLRVTPAPPPTHIGLLVDDSAAAQPVIRELRESLWSFVGMTVGLDPAPQIGLMTFGDRPTRVAPHAMALDALEPAIERLFARPGSGAYLLDAIMDETAALERAGAERPVIVVFVVENSTEFSSAVRRRVEEALQRTGASLWTMTLQGQARLGLDEITTEYRERAAVITDVAKASGGTHRSVLSQQGLAPAMEQLGNVLTSRYRVTYGRPESLVPPERLAITVRRDDVTVLAPSWPRQ